MSRHKAEPKKARQMRVVRAWMPGEYGAYKYYMLFSDGEIRPSSRKEADQYTEAYLEEIPTIVGEPTEATWSSIGN